MWLLPREVVHGEASNERCRRRPRRLVEIHVSLGGTVTDSHQFYSFAALIIPVLLFGGAVTESWKPAVNARRVGLLAVVVWATMIFAIVAEMIAIIATFGGEPETGERVVVGVAMGVGTVAAAGAVAWPWLTKLPNTPKRNLISGGVAVGVILTLLLLINTGGTPSSQSTEVEKALVKVSNAESRLETQVAEYEALQSAVQRKTQRQIGSMAHEVARAQAADLKLLLIAEQH
jgi:hypothetical protein